LKLVSFAMTSLASWIPLMLVGRRADENDGYGDHHPGGGYRAEKGLVAPDLQEVNW
jgi:hypothetical protein